MITFSTPPGSPASSRISASASIDSGVCFAGFTTIVQPAAMAGPILRVPIAIGKFHGVIIRHGPTGCCMTSTRPAPLRRDCVVAVDPQRLLGEPAEELGRVGDLGLRLGERLAHLERHQQRQVVGALGEQLERLPEDLARARSGGVAAHSACASAAASSAAMASSGVPSATSQSVSPVAGSSTASVSPPTRRATRRRCRAASGPPRRPSVLQWRCSCRHGLRSQLLGDRHVDRVVDRQHDQRRQVERRAPGAGARRSRRPTRSATPACRRTRRASRSRGS